MTGASSHLKQIQITHGSWQDKPGFTYWFDKQQRDSSYRDHCQGKSTLDNLSNPEKKSSRFVIQGLEIQGMLGGHNAWWAVTASYHLFGGLKDQKIWRSQEQNKTFSILF